MSDMKQKSDVYWRQKLDPEQYRVLREKGTEAPFTGILTDNFESGMYECAGCGTSLFSSDAKFHSDCGWPSFDRSIGQNKNVELREDLSHGMVRTEVLCRVCGGHLGHVFEDGPKETTGQRYCINSAALQFKKELRIKN
jgi:peptide-methionine (R)-S-oxide reductase